MKFGSMQVRDQCQTVVHMREMEQVAGSLSRGSNSTEPGLEGHMTYNLLSFGDCSRRVKISATIDSRSTVEVTDHHKITYCSGELRYLYLGGFIITVSEPERCRLSGISYLFLPCEPALPALYTTRCKFSVDVRLHVQSHYA